MKEDIDRKIKEKLSQVQYGEPLENHTTFRIGGPAKYFLSAGSKEEIIKAVETAKELKIPFYILGGGSKLLISDQGFNGLIIKTQNTDFEVQANSIATESGVPLKRLVNESAVEHGLTGLEWAAGIPGTVGGAVRGNAGAWGKSMKDIIKQVEAWDTDKKEKIIFDNRHCNFDYRNSIFKENPNLIILSCVVCLEKGNKEKSREKIQGYINYRKENHPLEFPSAGSIFENPSPKLSPDGEKPEGLPAGKIIGECGLAGKIIGGAKISEKHSNFIVNVGGGKSDDVKKLIALAKKEVKKKFDITLREELQYLE